MKARVAKKITRHPEGHKISTMERAIVTEARAWGRRHGNPKLQRTPRPNPIYFARNGKPMTLLQWAISMSVFPYRRVAFTSLPNGDVSTVWLGLDHSFGHGPRQVYETMVFAVGDAEYRRRYATKAEALAGHQQAVNIVRRQA